MWYRKTATQIQFGLLRLAAECTNHVVKNTHDLDRPLGRLRKMSKQIFQGY